MANSTELLCHHHASTMMSKLKHGVSEIFHQPHENEEEVRQRHKTPEYPYDENISMTRSMFKSIMTKALEEKKLLADETSMQVAKVAFTEGVKPGSQRLTQPNHSSPMETESDCLSHNAVTTNGDFGLQYIHQLRPETSEMMAPFTANHTAPAQQAAKLPVYCTQYGAMDGYKTFQSAASFNTGKIYKRETNLKFSERTVEQYESFRSQFNIHHKMLPWETNRDGIEFYIS